MSDASGSKSPHLIPVESGSEPVAPDLRVPAARLHIWQIQAVRDVLFITAIVALVWAGYAMRAVTVPLLIALTLAYLFEPLVSRLTAKPHTSRPRVVGGLLIIVGSLFFLLLFFTVPAMFGETRRLIEDVRSGRFHETLIKAREYVPENYRTDYDSVMRRIMPELGIPDASGTPASQPSMIVVERPDDQRVRDIVREELALRDSGTEAASGNPLLAILRGGGRAALHLLGTVVQVGLLAFLIPFYFYFFSVSYPAVVRFGRNMIPEAQRPRILELVAKMDRAVAGFVRGRLIICLITGVMLAILWLIVGVPYAIVLGMVVGAFFLVPFLSGVGIPLAVILLAVDQLSLPADQRMTWYAIILWPTAMFLFVNAIETYVLTPMIAGKATNLDPVTILVAVLAGGSVGGVYGMILAIPVAACAKILLTDVVLPKIKQWVRGEAEDPLPISRS